MNKFNEYVCVDFLDVQVVIGCTESCKVNKCTACYCCCFGIVCTVEVNLKLCIEHGECSCVYISVCGSCIVSIADYFDFVVGVRCKTCEDNSSVSLCCCLYAINEVTASAVKAFLGKCDRGCCGNRDRLFVNINCCCSCSFGVLMELTVALFNSYAYLCIAACCCCTCDFTCDIIVTAFFQFYKVLSADNFTLCNITFITCDVKDCTFTEKVLYVSCVAFKKTEGNIIKVCLKVSRYKTTVCIGFSETHSLFGYYTCMSVCTKNIAGRILNGNRDCTVKRGCGIEVSTVYGSIGITLTRERTVV